MTQIGGSWKWLVGGVLVGGVTVAALVVVSGLERDGTYAEPPAPLFTVFPHPTRAPSATPTAAAAEPTPLPGTPTPDPSAGHGIVVGDLVEVYGTGGDGLRIRTEAGLSTRVLFLALENEVLQVRGGPAQADGRVWWFVANPNDESKSGWAVAEYLRRIGAR